MLLTVMKKDSFFRSNVFLVGLLSFFGGVSQDMFVPVLPLYLSGLHFSASFIGVSAGVVTAAASMFQIVAGWYSDRSKARKPFVAIGYAASLVGRFALAFATGGAAVFSLRFLDGVGKGLKASSKDALLADSTERDRRGRGFGIVRALDTLGSVAGPLVLFGLLYLWRSSEQRYHYVFIATAIPLVITLFIILFGISEPAAKAADTTTAAAKNVLPKKFYGFLALMLLFSLGNSSDAFILLRAQNLGVTVLSIPLVYALFNLFYAAAAAPLGSLSDRIGRQKVIMLGWGCYALSYLGFALATRAYHAWLLFAFYGLYYATTEGVAKAFVADMVEPSARGRAYGIYNALIGLMALPASFIAGALWDKVSPSAPFWFGAGFAFVAALAFGLWNRHSLKTSPKA